MASSIGVLPVDVIECLRIQLNEQLGHEQPTSLCLVELPHPRTGVLTLFLPVRAVGAVASSILEVQCVSPNAERSWFSGGEVIADGKMLLMTPIDPAFLLSPLLQVARPQDGSTGNFKPLDDILEETVSKLSKQSVNNMETLDAAASQDVMTLGELPCIQNAMRRICETKDITTDLTVYRYSHEKFLDYLSSKVNRVGREGIIDRSRTLERELAKDGLMDDGKEELLAAGKQKLACELISQYIHSDVYQDLLKRYDFSSLNAHLEVFEAATRIRDIETNTKYAGEAREENQDSKKKRKSAVQASKGVEKLKKVNTVGMAKISTFFQKKTAPGQKQ